MRLAGEEQGRERLRCAGSQLQCSGKPSKGVHGDSHPECSLLEPELLGQTVPAEACEPCRGSGEAM